MGLVFFLPKFVLYGVCSLAFAPHGFGEGKMVGNSRQAKTVFGDFGNALFRVLRL